MSGEGDSTPRSKRIKKEVIVISSSSDSDSDENVGVAGTRRKKLRILSADDGNESSSSSVVFVGMRRRISSSLSGSSEDKCSICLQRFTSQEVGIPNRCRHVFCLDCILEWSKNRNTCPVDRKLYKSIEVRACAGGQVLRTQPMQDVNNFPFQEEPDDLPYCEGCDTQDRAENMMMCEQCEDHYHMRCITPALAWVPRTWFCMPCRRRDHEGLLDEFEMDEIRDAERAPINKNVTTSNLNVRNLKTVKTEYRRL